MNPIQDYENDEQRRLRITDPYGNESNINNPKYAKCECGIGCEYESMGKCIGSTHMMDDTKHLCDYHAGKLGSDQIWYKSEPQKSEGPVQRMLGMEGDNVKELSNFGGQYKDEEDIGQDYSKEDPRTINGEIE